MDCPFLRYGFRSQSDLLCGSYEYCYLSVDDRSGYANGTFSTTKLGEMDLAFRVTDFRVACMHFWFANCDANPDKLFPVCHLIEYG